jgi:hypothetical protein
VDSEYDRACAFGRQERERCECEDMEPHERPPERERRPAGYG